MSRVLLVDDEKNVLKTLSIGLRRYKYIVRQARSGPEALKIMEEDPCDILVSDVRMRPMDGYKLASHFRHNFPEVGIVLMSAFGFKDELAARLESLDCPQLVKPFTVPDLIRVLREEEERGYRGVKNGSFPREKKRCLFVGGENDFSDVCQIGKDVGCDIDCIQYGDYLLKRIKKVDYDIFLIDGDILDDKRWKILNAIDQQGPGKPVILLVRKNGDKSYLSTPYLSMGVLDRETFFKDRFSAVRSLKKCLEDT